MLIFFTFILAHLTSVLGLGSSSPRQFVYRVDTRSPLKIAGCNGFVCPERNWEGRPEIYDFKDGEKSDKYGVVFKYASSAKVHALGNYKRQRWIYQVDVTNLPVPAESGDIPGTTGGMMAVYQATYSRIRGYIHITRLGAVGDFEKNNDYNPALPPGPAWHASNDFKKGKQIVPGPPVAEISDPPS